MNVRSTLRVMQQACPGRPRVTVGETYQALIGVAQSGSAAPRTPPGSLERIHWHPIEALYYIVSGEGRVRDIEGTEYPVRGGSLLYGPAGIAGSHEWEVPETLELPDIRATNDASRKLQFTVDLQTKRSYIDLDELEKREAISFPSHY